jgi:glycosyltransferase involved in cell wall biosynthesis
MQKIHVLIIPGEELNSNNLYSSNFEIQQAFALREQGINIGFLSLKVLPSCRTLLKENIFNPLNLAKIFGSKLFKKSSYISEDKIQGINLIEVAGSLKYPGCVITNQRTIINNAICGFEKYKELYGKPDLIHAHSRFLFGPLIAYHIKKKHNIPYVVTEHSTLYGRGLISDIDIATVRTVLNNAEAWAAVSKELGLLIKEKIGDLNNDFIEIPNILDKEFEDEKPAYVKNNSELVFLNIAYLQEKKRHDLLIKAFEICSKDKTEHSLRIGGDGPQRTFLEELIDKRKLNQKVKLIGNLSRKEVITEMKNCDIFVLSSDYETFGVVLIEALAMGKPIIATKCGGPESIINHTNGILVPKNNIYDLASAMTKMIKNYDKYNPENIREDCLKRYGGISISRMLVSLYHQVLFDKIIKW